MRKITEDQYQETLLKCSGYTSSVVLELLTLPAGEAVIISNEEWNLASPPSKALHTPARRLGMKFTSKRLKGEGWLIKRLN